MTHIGFFSHFAARGTNASLQEILDNIKRGKWAQQIARLREIGKGSPEFDKVKRKLPAVMLSCTTNGGRERADVENHSGLLQLDIDGVGAEDAVILRNRIGKDRHILAAWLSPSGTGVKAAMCIPADVERHKAAFETAAGYMRETYGVQIDPACKNVNRLCFVSHDPALVQNGEPVPLEVKQDLGEATQKCAEREKKGGEVSTESASTSTSTSCIYITSPPLHLHNKLFFELPSLEPLYRRFVTRRYGEPQRGQRNQAMTEIVAACYYAIAPEFVPAFAEEYYHQHATVFGDYRLEQYRHEVASLLAACERSYPQRLNERERAAYEALHGEKERAAFRIAQSLSKCESDDTVPPPLFFLSCAQLGARIGVMDTPAMRILRDLEARDIIQTIKPGTLRTKGQKGVATVYRWML